MQLGIYGYGNIARGVECAVQQNPDMKIRAIFTRRDPETVKPLSGAPVYAAENVKAFQNEIDVMIICGGSATDLPHMTPELAHSFNVVDSFDTHARIPEHFAAVDAAALAGGHTALISGGWDPGLFSLNRLYAAAVLPEGKDYTFWGRGVSQGHSDAIRRVPGVLDARQYTVPIPEALEAVRAGTMPELTTRQKHRRECYVVAEEGADREAITKAIQTMPNYFDEYDTTVNFITAEELARDHAGLPHGGFVIRSGKLGEARQYASLMEFKLELDSNPMFTGAIMAAFGRACCRLHEQGQTGCFTVLDVPMGLLSPLSAQELRRKLV